MSRKKKCHRTKVSKLWNKNPHCHWCNIPTVRVDSAKVKILPNTATFDHLYHKSNPLRYTKKGMNLGVLACYACNQERGRIEHIKSLPAWNRWLIKLKVPIPVWKIRRKVAHVKKKFNVVTKKTNWIKRHIAYRIRKLKNEVD